MNGSEKSSLLPPRPFRGTQAIENQGCNSYQQFRIYQEVFLRDEKEMTVKELLESIINFLEFHGMEVEFYLPDPQDPTKLCFILWEDLEYSLSWVVKYFKTNMLQYDSYATNNMDYSYKAIMSVLDDLLKQSI